MSPIDWAKRPLQRYAQFSGRAPRAEYWWYTLFMIIAAFVIMFIERSLGIASDTWGYGPIYAIFSLALLVPNLAVTVRRLHDTNRSGWWLLLPLVPYVIIMAFTFAVIGSGGISSASGLGMAGTIAILGIVAMIAAIALLVFLLLPGTRGENRFGPDPYGPQDVGEVFA